MLMRVVNEDKEKYKQLYGNYPPHTMEGQRLFNEFRKLLKQYSLDDLIRQSQSPVTNKKQVTGIMTYHYEVDRVTSDLLIAHLKLIHDKWSIPIPVVKWWHDAIRKQALEMIEDYSKEELHYFMHKLENDNGFRENVTEPFTFKAVKRYIERSLIDKKGK